MLIASAVKTGGGVMGWGKADGEIHTTHDGRGEKMYHTSARSGWVRISKKKRKQASLVRRPGNGGPDTAFLEISAQPRDDGEMGRSRKIDNRLFNITKPQSTLGNE